MLHNKEIASNGKNRSYLMNMSTDRKRMGMTYLAEWHMEVRGVKADSTPIYNIHQVYDLGFLRELRKGGIQNSDRMSSSIIAMFMIKENVAHRVKTVQRQSDFYSRTLFTGTSMEDGTTSLY
jgi:hypothetical protein